MDMAAQSGTLGEMIKRIRSRNGWTLAQMSAKSGIPVSTLSKVEHDRLTLSYDKLQGLSQRLNIPLSALFNEGEARDAPSMGIARRSVATLGTATRVDTGNYDYYYLSTELRKKRMIPIVVRVHARSVDEFGPLVSHDGEEFIYVTEGAVEVHTEFYDPVTINVGEGMYIDSRMGHAYVVAPAFESASMIAVCASNQDDFQRELMAQASAESGAARTRGKAQTRSS